jgi:multidrug resistance efflux pump
MTIEATYRRNRDRPRERVIPYRHLASIKSSKRDTLQGEEVYFVKTPGKEVLQFGDKEYFLWRTLDGKNSFEDIQTKFRDRFGSSLTQEQLESFIEQLGDCGMIEPTGTETVLTTPLPNPRVHLVEDDLPIERTGVRLVFRLFNPTLTLRILDWICGPLRFFSWLLLPLVVAVAVTLPLQATAVVPAFARFGAAQITLLVLAALLATAITPPLVQAVVASFLGCSTPSCGISLRNRFVPVLAFDDSSWETMASRHVLTVIAAPCVASVALFAVGAGAWVFVPGLDPMLSAIALAIGLFGLLSFVVSTAPFLPGQGQRWLATVFGKPDPWRSGESYRLHVLVLSGLWAQVAVGTLLLLASILSPLWSPPSITAVLQSITLPILALAPVPALLWMRGMVKRLGSLRPAYSYVGDEVEALKIVPAQPRRDSGAPLHGPASDPWPSNAPIVIWAAILAVGTAFAFVPYPYEAGGSFTFLPTSKIQINATIQGELTEVLVKEGQWVEPGQLMGVLSDWDEQHNLENARAQLENAKANLQTLYETPRPEDVELARRQYEFAMSKLPYDKAQLDRAAELVKKEFKSRADYDQVVSTYQQDQAAAEVARANYDQVRSGPTPSQFEAARASVRQYTAAVTYYEDQLGRKRIRATSTGKVVTPNPQLLHGQWFNPAVPNATLVFTLEDHRNVQADVYVPETDIKHVQIGGAVRGRPWAYPNASFPGKVVSIAPNAQSDPNGGSTNVIRVRTEFPNPEGRLHPSETGYAKMTGVYLPTWEAFTQMLIRFFLVEVWSWIP